MPQEFWILILTAIFGSNGIALALAYWLRGYSDRKTKQIDIKAKRVDTAARKTESDEKQTDKMLAQSGTLITMLGRSQSQFAKFQSQLDDLLAQLKGEQKQRETFLEALGESNDNYLVVRGVVDSMHQEMSGTLNKRLQALTEGLDAYSGKTIEPLLESIHKLLDEATTLHADTRKQIAEKLETAIADIVNIISQQKGVIAAGTAFQFPKHDNVYWERKRIVPLPGQFARFRTQPLFIDNVTVLIDVPVEAKVIEHTVVAGWYAVLLDDETECWVESHRVRLEAIEVEELSRAHGVAPVVEAVEKTEEKP